MRTVYIETSIPSFYHTGRKSIQAQEWRAETRRWWDRSRPEFDLCTSQAVLTELAASPQGRGEPRLQLLDGVRLLPIDLEVDRIAQFYVAQRLVPAGPDSVHVALASFHAIDYLMTWNCKHIANVNKARHLAALNRGLGLHVPALVTPYTLLPESHHGK